MFALDILTRHQKQQPGGYNWYLDSQNDGDVDWNDVTTWVQDTRAFNTRFGDTDLDRDVDQVDVNKVNASIAAGGFGKGWSDGDFNGDGTVTIADSALMVYPWP